MNASKGIYSVQRRGGPSVPFSGLDSEGVVSKAKCYPFDPVRASCLYVNGSTVPMRDLDPSSGNAMVLTPRGLEAADEYLARRGITPSAWALRRYPLMASGSNASPSRLSRKLAGTRGDLVIPMVRARLQDFLIGYSAHFAAYGSIPATLHYCPGAEADLMLVWLAEAELLALHESESLGLNYRFVRLCDVRVDIDGGQSLSVVLAYVSLHGCLCVNESPIQPAAVDDACRFPHLSQVEVLALARDLVGAEGDLDQFIYENATDPQIRYRRTKKLSAYGRSFSYPWTDLIAGA